MFMTEKRCIHRLVVKYYSWSDYMLSVKNLLKVFYRSSVQSSKEKLKRDGPNVNVRTIIAQLFKLYGFSDGYNVDIIQVPIYFLFLS